MSSLTHIKTYYITSKMHWLIFLGISQTLMYMQQRHVMSQCPEKPTKDKHLFGAKASIFILRLTDVEAVAKEGVGWTILRLSSL